jgi:hypothetical protein
MTENRHQVSIPHLTQCVAFSERARLDGEVVHVGNALRCGFGIVAADTVLGVELGTERLLIAESNFLYRDLDTLSRCIAKRTSPQVHVKDEERVIRSC